MLIQSKLDAQTLGFKLDNWGHILSPGKFEGEHFSILYFYDLYMDGLGTIFELSAEEQNKWDIHSPFVYLAENSDGFCSLEFYDTIEEVEERETEDLDFDTLDDYLY